MKRSNSILLFWLSVAPCFLLPTNAAGRIPFRILPCILRQTDQLPYVEGECVVRFAPGITNNDRMFILMMYGLTPLYHSPYAGVDRVGIPPAVPIMHMVNLLRSEPLILYVEPNYLARAHLVPNDPLFQYQWNMIQIKADQAWNITGGAGVVVAVLDSGAAYENTGVFAQAPDLAGTIFVPGWDFVNSDANPDDDLGHGTHITGTIAQTTNNTIGCAGIAYGASIMPIKVLDNLGYGNLLNIVDGIYYAANNGAKVLNMSFGFGNNTTITLQNAVTYADTAECVMVCSAGNNASSLPNYPSSYTPCISVSATLFDLTLASYSNYGLDIDVCAPGGTLSADQNLDGYPDGILQQSHDGVNYTVFDYFCGEGTSWSCAHVTGVAAMVAAVGGIALLPSQIKGIIETSALDIGAAGWDEYFGWGLVDAASALLAVQQTATVLSASGLIPLFPTSSVSSPVLVAASAGTAAPISTKVYRQMAYPSMNPDRRMSFTPTYRPPIREQMSYSMMPYDQFGWMSPGAFSPPLPFHYQAYGPMPSPFSMYGFFPQEPALMNTPFFRVSASPPGYPLAFPFLAMPFL